MDTTIIIGPLIAKAVLKKAGELEDKNENTD